MDLSIPKFGKQFLIYKKITLPDEFNIWNKFNISEDYILRTHPDLTVTKKKGKSSLLLLGDIFDPYIPPASNEQILETLANTSQSFTELEGLLAKLGGRWILIATINANTRLYHDATGLKPIFYAQPADQNLIIGSQPALLEAVGATKSDPKLRDIMKNLKHPGSWPMNTIPYIGVTQLLPNHTLDLHTGSVKRYWPIKNLEPISTEDAAKQMSAILTGMIKAMTHRRDCIISLTGGYDSRMLLACAKPVWDKIKFHTISAPHM